MDMDRIGLGESWPEEDIESVDQCPVCGCSDRVLIHKNLRDRIFFCAPGEWSIYQCQDCNTGYLDPRPTPASIGLAYQNYFTHVKGDRIKLALKQRIRRTLADGYRRYQFGPSKRLSSVVDVLASWLIPRQKAIMDAGMRHLPRPSMGQRLLDVGCGSGEFLERARSNGWEVVGIELDPKAVEASQSRGLDVRMGSIDSLDLACEEFDGITIRHVIEHLYDPIAALKICHNLLKPKGWIWVETPNLSSQGHHLYGADWRDLDPPRHLIHFNPSSLRYALEQAGFDNVLVQPWRPMCSEVFPESEAIACGLDPVNQSVFSSDVRRKVRACDNRAKSDPGIREFITVKAWKK